MENKKSLWQRIRERTFALAGFELEGQLSPSIDNEERARLERLFKIMTNTPGIIGLYFVHKPKGSECNYVYVKYTKRGKKLRQYNPTLGWGLGDFY